MYKLNYILTQIQGSLGDTLREVRPTLFFGVPRVWEKIQEKMVHMGKNNGTIKKKMVTWARGVGVRGGYPLFF
jgi:long-subunit acyl-CoA synthetase (AMP-forming)